MLSRSYFFLTFFMIANVSSSPASAALGDQVTDEEIDRAEVILRELMKDGSGAADPTLHELLADVHAARESRDKATVEYAHARAATKEVTVKYVCDGGCAVNEMRVLFRAAARGKTHSSRNDAASGAASAQ